MGRLTACSKDDHSKDDHSKKDNVVVVYDSWEKDGCPLCAALDKIYELENKIEELEATIKDREAKDQSKGDEHDGMR